MTTTYAIGLRTRFRGIEVRQGMLWQGPAGWAEWSPFLDYSGPELKPWLAAAREAAEVGFPAHVRDRVPVNVTIPILPPDRARELAAGSGCRTAKIKVADPREDFAADLARIEAVRDGLGPGGRIRVDVNGAWDVDTAERHLRVLAKYDPEYAEQPVATVEELADLRRRLLRAGVSVPIAADESIRRAEDPQRVKELAAADVAVLKVQPLGGVRRCLDLADDLGLPVVVSSALETSVGLAAGVALAAALPELPYACGLNTGALLTDDVAVRPLRAVDGHLPVAPVEVDPAALARCRADDRTHEWWLRRREETAR